MVEVQGALVGIAMVLSPVFVPLALFVGTTGAIYRQFAITIVAALVLSVRVTIILTPAPWATLLKPLKNGENPAQNTFFACFKQLFNRNAELYATGVEKSLHSHMHWTEIY
ncbi:hypothetical protein AV889_26990, partial [Escherichia coli]